jgi:hypothetical protein
VNTTIKLDRQSVFEAVEIDDPVFGRATNTKPLFQLPFGCAAIRGRGGLGCARAKYNSTANGCE